MANKNPMSLPMMRVMASIIHQVKDAFLAGKTELKGKVESAKGVRPVDITKVRNTGSFRGTFNNHKSRTFKRNRRAELKRRKTR
jgi:hypothetical protein